MPKLLWISDVPVFGLALLLILNEFGTGHGHVFASQLGHLMI
jgi:hypothetical protein